MNTPPTMPVFAAAIVRAILQQVLEPQPIACYEPGMLEPAPIQMQQYDDDLTTVFFG